MALDALSLSTSDLLNFFINDTISATPYTSLDSSITPDHLNSYAPILMETSHPCFHQLGGGDGKVAPYTSPSSNSINNNLQHCSAGGGTKKTQARKANQLALGPQGRKKRRRRPRVCKNKEEAETQRMTHITVERNRRKQMNEHLAVLKSLMPESYVQRGDQASVVGGAIEFVKELEHLLQSLEAQRFEQRTIMEEETMSQSSLVACDDNKFLRPPFSQFFSYPQYTWSQLPNNNNLQSKYSAASSSPSTSSSININGNASAGGGTMLSVADIEVTLIETHANMRILSRKSPRQLSRLVAGFHTLHLSILHLNVTSLHPLVLYSISTKVEEGCELTTVDDIAGAVHHMLIIIEEGDGERGGEGGSLC